MLSGTEKHKASLVNLAYISRNHGGIRRMTLIRSSDHALLRYKYKVMRRQQRYLHMMIYIA